MGNVLIEESTLKNIGNAIREKTGESALILPKNMAREISEISSVKEPYIEETYDESGDLIGVKMVGQKKIRNNMFNECYKLVQVNLPDGITSIEDKAFYLCTSIESIKLPDGLTTIGEYAFSECLNLSKIIFPEKITDIGGFAFQGGDNLSEVTFKGTPNSISPGCFLNCTNLININVPWAEGVVADAPWGAYTASIRYNYTG